jgi:hypothetical protein
MYATRLCRFCRKSKKTKDLAAAAGFCRDFTTESGGKAERRQYVQGI